MNASDSFHWTDDDADAAMMALLRGAGRECSAADLASQAAGTSATADADRFSDGNATMPAGSEAAGARAGTPEAAGQLPRSASTLAEAGSTTSKLSPSQPPPVTDRSTESTWPGEITSSAVAAWPGSSAATAPLTTRDDSEIESSSLSEVQGPATPQGQLQPSFSIAADAGSVTPSPSPSPAPPLQGGLGPSSLRPLQGGEDVHRDAAAAQMSEGNIDDDAPSSSRQHAGHESEGGLPSAAAVTASVAVVSDWQPDSNTSSLPLSMPIGAPQAMDTSLQRSGDMVAGDEAQGELPAAYADISQ